LELTIFYLVRQHFYVNETILSMQLDPEALQ